MKRVIAIILAIILAVSLLCTAACAYDMTEDGTTYVTVYGLNQSRVSGVWAVTSQGRIDHIQVWDMELEHHRCLKSWEMMEPNHTYRVHVKVVGAVGDIVINGGGDWRAKSYGDRGTADRYVTGEYYFTTPSFFVTSWGWCNPWMPCVPYYGWRCW